MREKEQLIQMAPMRVAMMVEQIGREPHLDVMMAEQIQRETNWARPMEQHFVMAARKYLVQRKALLLRQKV